MLKKNIKTTNSGNKVLYFYPKNVDEEFKELQQSRDSTSRNPLFFFE